MLRRHHFSVRTSSFTNKNATSVFTVNTSYRTLFGKFGKSDSSNENNSNSKTSSFADELKLQQMKKAYEMLASQPKEKQVELMKQAMALQHSLSRIPGLGKLTEKNMSMMKEMFDQISTSPSASFTGSPSSQTIMTNNSFARTGMPSVDNAMLHNNNNNNNNNINSANNNVKSTSLPASRGPTLDELKKVNLGSEIEALFEELRTIRNKKNEYRQKYQDVQATLDNMLREKEKLISQEVDLRTRLRKTEQEVMTLTNQNMELEELKKQVKELTLAKRANEEEMRSLQRHANENPTSSSSRYVALQQQLQNKEDALRSLHRKLDRLRLRDPLLQFSLACSDIARLCDNTATNNNSNSYVDVNEGKGNADGNKSSNNNNSLAERAAQNAETAFNALRENFEHKQREAWEESANANGLAAMALASVVQRFCVNNIPYANLDAIITINVTNASADNINVNAIKSKLVELFAPFDFTIDTIPDAFASSSSSMSNVKLMIKSASDASSISSLPGPFGYAMVLKEINTMILNRNNNNKAYTKRYSNNSYASNNSNTHHESNSNSYPQVQEALQECYPWLTEFHVLDVAPFVSEELINNTHRSMVHMESARASGPGGQATNVSETQIYAKLSIDGANLYTTEAQNSRSALSNREIALDKLHHQKRDQFNEQLARQYNYEESVKKVVAHLHRIGGEHLSLHNSMHYVHAALENNSIYAANVMLICALEEWCKAAAESAEHSENAERNEEVHYRK